MKNKYFVVSDIKIATLMKSMLGEGYYKFKDNNDTTKTIFSFKYVDGISHVYGQAKTILENL